MVHCVSEPESDHRKGEIAVAMVTSHLEDKMMHFILRQKYWAHDGITCCMLRQGREDRSRTEYHRWWEKEGTEIEVMKVASVPAYAALEEEVEACAGGGVGEMVTEAEH